MGLEKAIEHGQEHRKKYRGGKAIDKTCRNHGGCSYCEGNRLHSSNVREESAKEKLEEWEKEQ